VSPQSVVAIVVAGGSGERFGRTEGKQLAEIAGRPMVSWSLLALDACAFSTIVVACDPARVDEFRDRAVRPLGLATPIVFAPSGATRQDSVRSGLSAAEEAGAEVVLVHDGARPLMRPETALGAVSMLHGHEEAAGVVVGHPSVDTVKLVERGRVVQTPDRAMIWVIQTPQVFRLSSLVAAHDAARADGFVGTDDAALVERTGGTVMVFEGPRDNIKITVPEDHAFAEAILGHREELEQ
jgi:2-C-methyl-D-erythritol 4-phosphate cytidylyltransferase